jgi:surface-anchored protein
MQLTRTRRASAALVALAALTAGVLVPAGVQASEGPPPASQTRQIISGVHTDAVSTFIDDGKLVLGTKADIGDLGTRFDPASSVVNIEDAARISIPDAPAYAFLGAPGSSLWLAAEVQQQGVVWPGFSTESVPVGTLDGNRVDIALTGFEGPGELEVWDSSGSFGAPGRIFSSREGSGAPNTYRFAVPQHKHANWGFTAAGSYSLTFTATATIGGAPQSATQTYSFVVGDIAPPVKTTATLAASPADLVLGESTALTATVAPAESVGAVEFFDGTTSLGHAPVENGEASLEVPMGTLGQRSLTASFVPSWTNDFTASTSASTTVIVTEEAGGDVFSIRGVATTYVSGDTMTATAVGATPAEGQSYRWLIRQAGGTATPRTIVDYSGGSAARGTLVRPLNSFYDGYEISAELRGKNAAGVDVTLQATPWVGLRVTGEDKGSGRDVRITGLADSYWSGDRIRVGVETASGLPEGAEYRWVFRSIRSVKDWAPVPAPYSPIASDDGGYLLTSGVTFLWEWAVQILEADGTVSGQSAPIYLNTAQRELQLSGAQSLYRVSDTISLGSSIYPEIDGVTYQWFLGSSPLAGQTSSSISVPATLEMNGQTLTLEAYRDNGFPADEGNALNLAATSFVPINVTDAAPGEQTAFFASLNEHYHQGNPVKLAVTLEPAATESDTVEFFWKRPDQSEFVRIPGTSGFTHTVRAQQALDKTEVHAVVKNSAGEILAETTKNVVIHVDDHGAPPAEKATITGLADQYSSGDRIELAATVAPESVLSRWEWYVQKAGDAAPVRVSDVDDTSFAVTASAGLDGAAVFARLTFDDGRRYIESAPVLIAVDGGNEVPATELTIQSNREPGDYWAGQTATLTAVQSVPTGLTEYRWFVKAPDAADFTVAEGKATDTFTFKPSPANSGTQVKVQLLDGGQVHAESVPVTFTAGQKDPVTTITVTGDKAEYAPGEVAHFVSSQDPATDVDHFHWYLKRAGSADYVWVDQSRDSDLHLPVTAEDDDAQLIIRMFDETHATIAESAPVTIEVAAATEQPEPVETDLTVTADAGGYRVGDTAMFTVGQSPETGLTDYHWFVKRTGDADYSIVPTASGATLSHLVADGDDGALIVAKLYDASHAVVAESTPVTLTVNADPVPAPKDGKPDTAPAAKSAADLDGSTAGGITLSATSVSAGSVVTVGLGADRAGTWNAAWLFSDPVLVGGDWVQANASGDFVVTIPATTPAGEHRVAAFDREGALIGWQKLAVTAASDVTPAPVPAAELGRTGSAPVIPAVIAAMLLVAGAGAVLVRARGRRVGA